MTDLEKLREMIESHHKIAFFGGAGVSTESRFPRGQWDLSAEDKSSLDAGGNAVSSFL